MITIYKIFKIKTTLNLILKFHKKRNKNNHIKKLESVWCMRMSIIYNFKTFLVPWNCARGVMLYILFLQIKNYKLKPWGNLTCDPKPTGFSTRIFPSRCALIASNGEKSPKTPATFFTGGRTPSSRRQSHISRPPECEANKQGAENNSCRAVWRLIHYPCSVFQFKTLRRARRECEKFGILGAGQQWMLAPANRSLWRVLRTFLRARTLITGSHRKDFSSARAPDGNWVSLA